MRKSSFFLILASSLLFYFVLVFFALFPSLPSPKRPLIFYSNQQRDDLRLVFRRIFGRASRSIEITMYALTDRSLLDQLERKAKSGIAVTIYYDSSTRSTISSPHLKTVPIHTRGLMHRKIVIVDDQYVFLGSANMTTSSLVLHDNISVGIYHPDLASFIQNPTSSYFDFKLKTERCRLWLLPDLKARSYLEEKINKSHSSLFIAMFTLTDPKLIEALIEADKRKVKVTVAVDRYTARGASKAAVGRLLSQGITILVSHGPQLFHHKWAYIDQEEIILGSTNWTQAAFKKNQDCLLFISSLSKKKEKIIGQLCKKICLELKPLKEEEL